MASDGGPNPSRLFYIHDRLSGLRFLVDTGAQVSIIPPSPSERNRSQEHSYLQAVNGTNIATYGIRSLTLDLGLRRSFRWTFIIANVKQPILGADFLQNFGLSGTLILSHASRYRVSFLISLRWGYPVV